VVGAKCAEGECAGTDCKVVLQWDPDALSRRLQQSYVALRRLCDPDKRCADVVAAVDCHCESQKS